MYFFVFFTYSIIYRFLHVFTHMKINNSNLLSAVIICLAIIVCFMRTVCWAIIICFMLTVCWAIIVCFMRTVCLAIIICFMRTVCMAVNRLLYANRLLGCNLVFLLLRDAAPLFLPLRVAALLFLPLRDATRISAAPCCHLYFCRSVLPLVFLPHRYV